VRKRKTLAIFSVFSLSPTHILAQSFTESLVLRLFQNNHCVVILPFAENFNCPEVTYSYILFCIPSHRLTGREIIEL